MAPIISISTLMTLMREKKKFYLTSLSRRGSVIPSTPTLPNINLTETIKIYLLHENRIKNDFKNLSLHHKPFQITFKSNSCLTSLSRRGTVNPSTPTFGSISLIETITNLVVA